MEVADIILLYADLMRQAFPFAVVFWGGNLIVTTFCRAAFTGKITFRSF